MLVEALVVQTREWSDFDDFVVGRSAVLWRSAWLLTGDAHRAEDLVQTVLAKAYPHFDRVGDGFEAYVRTALYRTYVSWWRRRWSAELPGEADAGSAEPPDLAQREDVRRALAALPRQQRAVIVLTYFDDLSGPQAAEVLGVSVGTIKSTLSRALAKLRTSPDLTDRSES